ncbi:C45 family peptidase [Candidatus Saccharibacteria bacterium]|nr:C45 family peptidase [Candidatus Saccharibacteria bacterium]
MINRLRYFEFEENEAGVNIGRIFSDAIRKRVAGSGNFTKNFYVMKQKLINTYPKYFQEVCDRARGAGVDEDKYLLFVSYELCGINSEKCTDVIVKNSRGEILYGHNEDGSYTLDNSAMVKHSTDKGWYIEYSCIDSLAGTTYLWNSSGIIFSGNYIYTEHKKLENISTWFILRDLVECGSINEIIDKIKSVESASGFNLNVVDTKNNRSYSIEFYLDKVSVVEITGKFEHTNHFIHLRGGGIIRKTAIPRIG